MHPDHIEIGDAVSASPVGAGTVTGITERGYPQVNHVAVAWLTRPDGGQFDPHDKVGGSKCADKPEHLRDARVQPPI